MASGDAPSPWLRTVTVSLKSSSRLSSGSRCLSSTEGDSTTRSGAVVAVPVTVTVTLLEQLLPESDSSVTESTQAP